MKFIFITDFHGNHSAYKRSFRAARDLGVSAVVLGGDILPKKFKPGTPFAKAQQEFWDTWLLPKFEKLRQDGIDVYVMFGNDDARGILRKTLMKADSLGTVKDLYASEWLPFGDYWILGIPWVPDYPFSLKDWVCGDEDHTICLTQFGSPLGTDQFHFVDHEVPWEEGIKTRATLKELLRDLPEPPDPSKAILVAHCPPAQGGLDMCADGRTVGSVALLRHIEVSSYLLTLHGHIHESVRTSGQWFSRVSDTLCVQPGALPPMYMVVDIDERLVSHPQHGEIRI